MCACRAGPELAELLVARGSWLDLLSLAADVWNKQRLSGLSLEQEQEQGQEQEQEALVRASELSSLAQLRAQVEALMLRYLEVSLGSGMSMGMGSASSDTTCS